MARLSVIESSGVHLTPDYQRFDAEHISARHRSRSAMTRVHVVANLDGQM